MKFSHVKSLCGIGTLHIRKFHICENFICEINFIYGGFTYEIFTCEIVMWNWNTLYMKISHM